MKELTDLPPAILLHIAQTLNNPMRGLGMDYVTLKLAGKIKPLHKRRRQITLHGF